MVAPRASTSVVEALAEKEDVPATELTPPLADESLDPDALDRLFDPDSTAPTLQGCVIFGYKDYDVIVHGPSDVTVLEKGRKSNMQNMEG